MELGSAVKCPEERNFQLSAYSMIDLATSSTILHSARSPSHSSRSLIKTVLCVSPRDTGNSAMKLDVKLFTRQDRIVLNP